MTDTERTEGATSILALPEDVLFVLLSYLDLQSLGTLSRVCRAFNHLVQHDCVWTSIRRKISAIGCQCGIDERWRLNNEWHVKELCRVAFNWKNGRFRESRCIYHRERQMPWIQYDGAHLWISYKNFIRCYSQRARGFLQEEPSRSLRGHNGDVGRFVVRDGVIISGSRNGSIYCFNKESDHLMWAWHGCHRSDVQDIDFYDNTVVSGSRDATVKVWQASEDSRGTCSQHHTIEAEDRVWSVRMCPDGRLFSVGTAGINDVSPLRVWDTQTGQQLLALGRQNRRGAGVLDMQFESPNTLLSCGYDTFVRLWDLRTPCTTCASEWEEPFDSTIYTVLSDGSNCFVSGTARHGLARLWDKRMTEPVQLYYSGKNSSPVYSLAFDPVHLYLGLDQGIYVLNFARQ